MAPWPRAASFPALCLLAAGCTTFEIFVPAGTAGSFPEYVGRPCEAAAHEGLVVQTAERGLEWQARAPGTVRVSCAKGSVRLSAVRAERVTVAVYSPLRLRDRTEYSLEAKAFGAAGKELELWRVRGEEIVWNAPPSVRLSQPRCGHMAALCVGSVGNGYLMNAEVTGSEPATVTVTVAGVVGTALLSPLPEHP